MKTINTFMPFFDDDMIKATDINDAWFQALNKIMTNGRRYLITKGSYERKHRAGLPVVIGIRHPGSRPLAVMMPEGSNIPPPTTEEVINQYCLYLMTSIRQPHEHYTYGEDLWWQIERTIDYYRENGHGTNHCYMTVGRPETFFHYDRGVNYQEAVVVSDRETKKIIMKYRRDNIWNKNKEIKTSSQCLRGVDTWIDDGRLWFWAYFRSWDHWGGFPVNVGGLQLVKEHMSSNIGVEDGPMIVSSKDLHVYESTWVTALMRLGKKDISDLKEE